MNPSLNQYREKTQKIIKLFQTLGFTVHSEPKSNFTPTQRIEFLGFAIKSVAMTITLNNNKKRKLQTLSGNLLSGGTTIRTISQVFGKITSSFPATKFGPLHYRNLEVFKTRALKYHRNNFKTKVCYQRKQKMTSDGGKTILTKSIITLLFPTLSVEIKTDASLNSWGAVMVSNSTGGLFSDEETQNHINFVERKAILFGLKCLACHIQLAHIKLMCENSTAVACINKFGTSHSGKCDTLSKQIWEWAKENGNTKHILGIQNTEADFESRKNEVHTKWKLRENIFNNICSQLNINSKIDLLATRLNTQLSTFVSYRPNPKCIAVNASL